METFHGGIQITTPPSQFRGVGSTGPDDGLVLDVPPQTGTDLDCIGASAGETIDIISAFSARVTIYLARGPVKLAKSCETAVHRATAFPGTRLGRVRREGPGCLDARATFRHSYLMDALLDPAKFAGLAECDAHVICNAGGRASDDAIRSLAISYKLLGTPEFFVIHHTDCGMESADHQGPAAVRA